MREYRSSFVARAEHIDELGHVNNAVWVQWIQDMATAHWIAAADPAHVAGYFWVVVRHEIDYRGNVGEGAVVHGHTWIEDTPRGARFDRHVAFSDASGKPLVRAVSTWAMIDRATGRPARVTPDIVAAFA